MSKPGKIVDGKLVQNKKTGYWEVVTWAEIAKNERKAARAAKKAAKAKGGK